MTVKHMGRRFLIFVVILGLTAGAAFWAFRNVGRWLVDPDDLEHARAIVVLSGSTPFRAMESCGNLPPGLGAGSVAIAGRN